MKDRRTNHSWGAPVGTHNKGGGGGIYCAMCINAIVVKSSQGRVTGDFYWFFHSFMHSFIPLVVFISVETTVTEIHAGWLLLIEDCLCVLWAALVNVEVISSIDTGTRELFQKKNKKFYIYSVVYIVYIYIYIQGSVYMHYCSLYWYGGHIYPVYALLFRILAGREQEVGYIV